MFMARKCLTSIVGFKIFCVMNVGLTLYVPLLTVFDSFNKA